MTSVDNGERHAKRGRNAPFDAAVTADGAGSSAVAAAAEKSARGTLGASDEVKQTAGDAMLDVGLDPPTARDTRAPVGDNDGHAACHDDPDVGRAVRLQAPDAADGSRNLDVTFAQARMSSVVCDMLKVIDSTDRVVCVTLSGIKARELVHVSARLLWACVCAHRLWVFVCVCVCTVHDWTEQVVDYMRMRNGVSMERIARPLVSANIDEVPQVDAVRHAMGVGLASRASVFACVHRPVARSSRSSRSLSC